jgi:hypothetical protein
MPSPHVLDFMLNLEHIQRVHTGMGKTIRAQEDLNLRPLDPQSNALSTELWARVSERVGFEPTVPVKAQLLSREPDSAALAPLLSLLGNESAFYSKKWLSEGIGQIPSLFPG